MNAVAARSVVLAHVLTASDAPAEARAAALPIAQGLADAHGGIVVSTCHRVEWYRFGELGEPLAAPFDEVGARVLDGEAVARHAIGLAVGLESAVLGEDQVLHQLRTSVADARRRGAIAPPMQALFDHALRAGRIARSWRPDRPRSLADVAVDRLGAVHGSLDGRRILVIGAGEMGRLVALAATRRGALLDVASPTPAHAAAVVDVTGGRTLAFDPGSDALQVDGLIVALSGPWIASAATLTAAQAVPVVIDLSMPPALPKDLVAGLGSRHVGLDDLMTDPGAGDLLPAASGPTDRYRRRLEALRERTVRDYALRLSAQDAAGALARQVEYERAAEVEALWRRLPDLAPADRAAIEGMTRQLAQRLFRGPLERMTSDPDGRSKRAAEELFGL